MSEPEVNRLAAIAFTFGNDEGASAQERVREVLEELLRKDKSLPLIDGTSPQLELRGEIMAWLMRVTLNLKLLRKTLFLAAYLYDRFTDRHDISPKQIHLVALICLQLAAKLEENEAKVPKLEALSRELPTTTEFAVDLFLSIEKMILKFFKYKLLYPTVMDFFEYFFLSALDGFDAEGAEFDLNNNSDQSKAAVYDLDQSKAPVVESKSLTLLRRIENASTDFMNTVLSDYRAGSSRPSLLAAAAVLAGRKTAGLRPWSAQLESLTFYDQATVELCAATFMPQIFRAFTIMNLIDFTDDADTTYN